MPKKKASRESSGPVFYHSGNFPPQSIDWAQLVPLIGPANAALARYDGLLLAIPNAAVLLSPMTTQEAVLSSRIEGTQATMGEVFEYQAGKEQFDPAKVADIHEILNYRRAMRQAVDALVELPLCGRLIKQSHATLLDYLFEQPVFNSSDFIRGSKIPDSSARRILSQLTEANLIQVVREAKGQHAAIYMFSELLNIAEGRDVF